MKKVTGTGNHYIGRVSERREKRERKIEERNKERMGKL
jgi:hypothetical protein